MRDIFRLRHIIRKRSLLLDIMLQQGTSWYALDSKEYLLPPPCSDGLEIELQTMANELVTVQHTCKGLLKFILSSHGDYRPRSNDIDRGACL